MLTKIISIQWPAILKLDGEDILFYLSSDNALNEELTHHYLSGSDDNFILDINAQCYTLEKQSKNLQIPLQEFNQLVRNHLSARQQCCVLKVSIESFRQGFDLVLNTAED